MVASAAILPTSHPAHFSPFLSCRFQAHRSTVGGPCSEHPQFPDHRGPASDCFLHLLPVRSGHGSLVLPIPVHVAQNIAGIRK